MTTPQTGRWAWRCPNGHTSWKSRSNWYICATCRAYDHDIPTDHQSPGTENDYAFQELVHVTEVEP